MMLFEGMAMIIVLYTVIFYSGVELHVICKYPEGSFQIGFASFCEISVSYRYISFFSLLIFYFLTSYLK